MKQMSNEQLCSLAKQGNLEAANLLIEKNLSYVRETAYELWNTQKELNQSLGIMPDDLIQEGSIGLYHCIGSYDPDSGNKFLTYASPAIYNAMLDYIRRQNTAFESRHLNEIVRLDDVTRDENRSIENIFEPWIISAGVDEGNAFGASADISTHLFIPEVIVRTGGGIGLLGEDHELFVEWVFVEPSCGLQKRRPFPKAARDLPCGVVCHLGVEL